MDHIINLLRNILANKERRKNVGIAYYKKEKKKRKKEQAIFHLPHL